MRLGILGGGQLARMIIEETSKYGFEYVIYSESPDSPAGKICSREIVGKFSNLEKLNEFSSQCDLVTLENEFIDKKYIEHVEASRVKCLPGSDIVGLIQDKLLQKKKLKELNIPVPEFEEVNTLDDIKNFARIHSYPVILKSRTMGYDGKGNLRIDEEGMIDEAFNALSERGKLMCESFIDFRKELAVQVVRSVSGEVKVYPVVESIQKDHICSIVKASKDFDNKNTETTTDIAVKIVESINYIGVLAVEFFLMEDGKLYVNELAPRVHNTGHYTIEGCYVSQFENHVRAITGLPLGSTDMIYPCSVMINLLGSRAGKANLEGYYNLVKDKYAYIHYYGKEETRVGRKMGHITLVGNDMADLLFRAYKYHSQIKF
ncbi:MAG: 5-(carboxyamino)imidazole ribonucleotide synthase [Ignavibacteria bacterium]